MYYMKTPVAVSAVFLILVTPSLAEDFLERASRDFQHDSEAMEQQMQNDITDLRLQRLENQRVIEAKRKEAAAAAAVANHNAWLRKADASFNATWSRTRSALIENYPDLKNSRSTMFLLFQRMAQDYRDQENPILFDAAAARLIADNAARQLGIDRNQVQNDRALQYEKGQREGEKIVEKVLREPDTSSKSAPRLVQTDEQKWIQRRSEFLNNMEESKPEIIRLYPDAALPDSPLSRRTVEIVNRFVVEKNSVIRSANAPMLITEMAAKELGIAPKR
jgi:hypothetical protein